MHITLTKDDIRKLKKLATVTEDCVGGVCKKPDCGKCILGGISIDDVEKRDRFDLVCFEFSYSIYKKYVESGCKSTLNFEIGDNVVLEKK